MRRRAARWCLVAAPALLLTGCGVAVDSDPTTTSTTSTTTTSTTVASTTMTSTTMTSTTLGPNETSPTMTTIVPPVTSPPDHGPPCADVDWPGYVVHDNVEDGDTRILATEGSLPRGQGPTDAPRCQLDGPPVGADALVSGSWVELDIEPASYEMGPGGPMSLSAVVYPIWFPPCDGEPIVADRLRLRLAETVTLDVDSVNSFEQHVDFVVGCDGALNPITVGRPFTFRGYG